MTIRDSATGQRTTLLRVAAATWLLLVSAVVLVDHMALSRLAEQAQAAASTAHSNARSSCRCLRALARQSDDAHIYAPRPDFLPVGSISTSPSGVRTTRSNSFFGFISRHPTHMRMGIFLGFITSLAAPYRISSSSDR